MRRLVKCDHWIVPISDDFVLVFGPYNRRLCCCRAWRSLFLFLLSLFYFYGPFMIGMWCSICTCDLEVLLRSNCTYAASGVLPEKNVEVFLRFVPSFLLSWYLLLFCGRIGQVCQFLSCFLGQRQGEDIANGKLTTDQNNFFFKKMETKRVKHLNVWPYIHFYSEKSNQVNFSYFPFPSCNFYNSWFVPFRG